MGAWEQFERNEGRRFNFIKRSQYLKSKVTRTKPVIVPRLSWDELNAVWKKLNPRLRAEISIIAEDRLITIWAATEALWNIYGTELPGIPSLFAAEGSKVADGWVKKNR